MPLLLKPGVFMFACHLQKVGQHVVSFSQHEPDSLCSFGKILAPSGARLYPALIVQQPFPHAQLVVPISCNLPCMSLELREWLADGQQGKDMRVGTHPPP